MGLPESVAFVSKVGAGVVHDMSRNAIKARFGLGEAAAREAQAVAAGMVAAKEPPEGRTHLVIGDAHAKPGDDFVRFRLLGRMVRDLAPDVVVQIGDWYDMPSLCSYDKGKASAECRRMRADIEAGDKAVRIVHDEAGGQLECADRYATIGNHTYRIDRFADDHPELVGMFSSVDSTLFGKAGWHVSPFLEPVEVDGVWYCHYFQSGPMGRPIGGVNVGRSLVLKQHASCTQGHSHIYNHYGPEKGDPGGTRYLHGMSCGWFGGEREHYARQSNEAWWCGIVVKRNVRDGHYDPEPWSYDRILAEWGTAAERR